MENAKILKNWYKILNTFDVFDDEEDIYTSINCVRIALKRKDVHEKILKKFEVIEKDAEDGKYFNTFTFNELLEDLYSLYDRDRLILISDYPYNMDPYQTKRVRGEDVLVKSLIYLFLVFLREKGKIHKELQSNKLFVDCILNKYLENENFIDINDLLKQVKNGAYYYDNPNKKIRTWNVKIKGHILTVEAYTRLEAEEKAIDMYMSGILHEFVV